MTLTSPSSDKSQTPESGATGSPWQPSWWQWLISALSGTVEIEKQTALLEQSNEEAKIAHEQRLSELRQQNARLAELESKLKETRQQQNAKLAELESKLKEIRHS